MTADDFGICERLVEAFGRERPVGELCSEDFATFLARFSKGENVQTPGVVAARQPDAYGANDLHVRLGFRIDRQSNDVRTGLQETGEETAAAGTTPGPGRRQDLILGARAANRWPPVDSSHGLIRATGG